MLGFQFVATVVARIAGNKDADFMDTEPKQPLPLDSLEHYLKTMAGRNGST